MPGETVVTMYGSVIPKHSIFQTSPTQQHRLGDRAFLGNRVFHYAKAGAVALEPSRLTESAAHVAHHLKCALAAAALPGAMRLRVTLGATAATLNQYAEGYLSNDSGASGYAVVKIKSHLAIPASGSGWIELMDPYPVGMTSGHFVTLTRNEYDLVVLAATTAVGIVVGVPPIAVPAGSFFWNQTWGPANVLFGAGPPALNAAVMRSGATAGAVIAQTAGNPIVGWVMRAEAAADYGLVFLTIAP